MEANPLMEPFMATADATAAARSEVDLEMAREVFHEAATMLHNSLALDGLDDHDLQVVVTGLCSALVSEDPGAAIRSRAAESGGADLHDPEAVAGAYLVAVSVLQL